MVVVVAVGSIAMKNLQEQVTITKQVLLLH